MIRDFLKEVKEAAGAEGGRVCTSWWQIFSSTIYWMAEQTWSRWNRYPQRCKSKLMKKNWELHIELDSTIRAYKRFMLLEEVEVPELNDKSRISIYNTGSRKYECTETQLAEFKYTWMEGKERMSLWCPRDSLKSVRERCQSWIGEIKCKEGQYLGEVEDSETKQNEKWLYSFWGRDWGRDWETETETANWILLMSSIDIKWLRREIFRVIKQSLAYGNIPFLSSLSKWGPAVFTFL